MLFTTSFSMCCRVFNMQCRVSNKGQLLPGSSSLMLPSFVLIKSEIRHMSVMHQLLPYYKGEINFPFCCSY